MKSCLLNKINRFVLLSGIVALMMFLPVLVSAQAEPTKGGVQTTQQSQVQANPSAENQADPESNNQDDSESEIVTLSNPFGGNLLTLEDFMVKLLNGVVAVGVPILALMIIYVGFLFVKNADNPKELENAKKALLWTLVAAAILLGSYGISQAISNTVQEITEIST